MHVERWYTFEGMDDLISEKTGAGIIKLGGLNYINEMVVYIYNRRHLYSVFGIGIHTGSAVYHNPCIHFSVIIKTGPIRSL